jgi:peptide/nickel transport system substrate-binding protein
MGAGLDILPSLDLRSFRPERQKRTGRERRQERRKGVFNKERDHHMKRTSLMLGAAALALAPAAALAERGASGHLNIIYWQAPSTLNPFLSGGTKEIESASLVLESMARFDNTGTMVPWLGRHPDRRKRRCVRDLTSITWTIKDGIMWSDGTPLTSADFAFTYEYCTDPEGGCAQASFFDGVTSSTPPTSGPCVVNFEGPTPFPYTAFVGSESPVIQAAQFADCMGARAPECTEANFGPIGTGPFVVDEFRPNDVIEFSANPNYRNPDQPGFRHRDLPRRRRCGFGRTLGLPDGRVRLRLEPADRPADPGRHGSRGELHRRDRVRHLGRASAPEPDQPRSGAGRRALHRRGRSAPVPDEPGDRSGHVHGHRPRAAGRSRLRRRRSADLQRASGARALCLDRQRCLPDAGHPGAIALLDEAGIVDTDGDGIREYDGTPLSVVYQTSTNAVRQDTQALVQAWWAELGIDTELRNIDASVFFGGDPASPDTFQKFYADIEMYTNNFAGVDPQAYMATGCATTGRVRKRSGRAPTSSASATRNMTRSSPRWPAPPTSPSVAAWRAR